MSAEWKEVYIVPGIDEEIPDNSILLINQSTGNQMVHAIVPIYYTTDGTLLWETGMDPESAPDSYPPNRFAGWRT